MTLQRVQEILAGDWYACFGTIKKGQDRKYPIRPSIIEQRKQAGATLVQEWDYGWRENGQVAMGRPILQDPLTRRTGM